MDRTWSFVSKLVLSIDDNRSSFFFEAASTSWSRFWSRPLSAISRKLSRLPRTSRRSKWWLAITLGKYLLVRNVSVFLLIVFSVLFVKFVSSWHTWKFTWTLWLLVRLNRYSSWKAAKILKCLSHLNVFKLITVSTAALLSSVRIFERDFGGGINGVIKIALGGRILEKLFLLRFISCKFGLRHWSFCALSGWSGRWILFQDTGWILKRYFFIFSLRHRESEGDHEFMADSQLRNSLSVKGVDSFRSGSLFVIAMSKLSIVIETPWIGCSLSRQNISWATFGNLEI